MLNETWKNLKAHGFFRLQEFKQIMSALDKMATDIANSKRHVRERVLTSRNMTAILNSTTSETFEEEK